MPLLSEDADFRVSLWARPRLPVHPKPSDWCRHGRDGDTAVRRFGAWKRLYDGKRLDADFPLVKICGLTNRQDALAAADAGADLLGFVLARSPRQTTTAFIKSCADIPLPRVAVLVQGEQIPAELPALIADGIVDFVQFHGDSLPEVLRGGAAWQAMNLRTTEDVSRLETAWSPAVLLDAWSETHNGGTGKTA